LDRWTLAFATALLIILIVAGAVALVRDQSEDLPTTSTPLADAQTAGNAAPGFATIPSPGEAAAATAAASTSALLRIILTAAPATPVAVAGAAPKAAQPLPAQSIPSSASGDAMASATPSIPGVSPVPSATPGPAQLGDVPIQPPVFVPEIAWPASRPGAPALGSLTGTGPPGAVVRIYDGKALIGQTQAGEDKEWRCHVPSTLQPGSHVLSVTLSYSGPVTGTLLGAAVGATPGPAALASASLPATVIFSVPMTVSAAGTASVP
jgi:hypothetical protein